MESGQPLALSDAQTKRIFAWFKQHTKAKSHQIGDFYVGTFFYDAEIWPVAIPVIYGTVALNLLDSLPTMPESLKVRLNNSEPHWSGYFNTFADCLDVGLLLPECERSAALPAFAHQLLAAGNETLSAVAELLLLRNPNPKALGQARMATEIFLKAFIVAKDGLTEDQVKTKYGHNLEKAMKRVLEIAPSPDLAQVQPRLTIFPEVQERYESNKWAPLTLWNGYSLALHTAATVLRLLTGQDSRTSVSSHTP